MRSDHLMHTCISNC